MTNYEKIKKYERCGEMKAYDIRNKYDGFIVEVILRKQQERQKVTLCNIASLARKVIFVI